MSDNEESADKATGPTVEGATGPTAEAPGAAEQDDQATAEALRAEARKWQRRATKDAEALKALQEQVKGLVSPDQIHTKEQALAQAQAERDSAKVEALKYRVALEAGLPADLAARLVGADEDELKRDAASLKAMLKPAKGTPDMHAGTQPGAGEKKPDANAALRMALGLGG